MVASSAADVGWGRAERRRRWWSWVGVIVSAGGEEGDEEADEVEEVLEDLLAGGRRERTDQVGLERRAAMSSLVFREDLGEGLGDSLTAGVVDSFAEVVVEL
jgi:hypothetical protein